MNSHDDFVNSTTSGGFLNRFIESNVEMPPDGLNGDCIVHFEGDYSKYQMMVRLLNGVREGEAMIVNDGVPYMKLAYRNGVLIGNVERLNENAVITMKGQVKNGMENGIFEEYDDNRVVVWRGYYQNGVRYSEVVESKRVMGYYEERRVGTGFLLSIAQYDTSLHDKHGRCLEYENGEWVGDWLYENGVKKYMIREYRNGTLTLYNRLGNKIYEGQFSKEEVKNGLYEHGRMKGMNGYCKELNSHGGLASVGEYDQIRMKKNGKCYELDNGRVQRVCLYERDVMKRVMIEFYGSTMTEYDDNRKKVYIGNYTGDMKKGFKRNERGYCLDENEVVKQYCSFANGVLKGVIQEFNGMSMTEYNEKGIVSYLGEWKGDINNDYVREGKGKEYDEDGKVVYEGEWKNGKREGMGTEFYNMTPVYMGEWKNGLRNGSGKEMDKEGRVVFVGEWKDGKGRGKEMDGNGNVVYEGEWSNGKRNGVGEELTGMGIVGHWKDGKKDGMVYERDGNQVIIRGCIFENDEMKRIVDECEIYDMILSGRIGVCDIHLLDDSSFFVVDTASGSTNGIFQMNRKYFSVNWMEHGCRALMADMADRMIAMYKGGKWYGMQCTKEVIDLGINGIRWEGSVKNGKPCGYGIVYDEEGRKEYEGFVIDGIRTCYGIEYYTDIGRVQYEGCYYIDSRFGKGVLYDRYGGIEYDGLWKDDEPYSPHFDGETIDNHTESIDIPSDSFNESESFVLPSFIHSLKRIVIGKNCLGSVHMFELDGLNELESVEIGKESFRITSFTTSDCRIVNCPKLKSIQIGYESFSDYHSFELSNLPSLQSIELSVRCFKFAPSFSLTSLIG